MSSGRPGAIRALIHARFDSGSDLAVTVRACAQMRFQSLLAPIRASEECWKAAPQCAAACACAEGFAVEPIGVDQAGEQYLDPERIAAGYGVGAGRERELRKLALVRTKNRTIDVATARI